MLIDAHSHLDRYENTVQSALGEITQHTIFTISNSMDLPSYKRNLKIGEMCELVLPTFGVHPWNAPEYVEHLEDLSTVIEQSPIIGEIGLDYHFVEDTSQYPAQQKVFEFFLSAAKEQGKIINVHTKGAEKKVLHLLNRYDIQRSIIHWYSGPLDVFHELVARGVYFTIGIEVLRAEHIKTIARELPANQLLTETDNPGGLEWLTGTPGMPAVIKDVIEALAKLRKTTTEDIMQTVQTNFLRLIQNDPWLSTPYARLDSEINKLK